jgi:molybdate transport system substrate-binding protein
MLLSRHTRRREFIAPRLIIFAAGLLIADSAPTSAAEIKMLSANGAKLIVVDLVNQFEHTSNNKVVISYGEAGDLRKRIEGGEAFDMVLLPGIQPLVSSGKLASDSVIKVAHSDLGLGMRSDAPKPDTSTAEGLKRLLLGAKAIVYTDPATGGAAGVRFVQILNQLGIADEINKKSKLVSGIHNAELVAKGEADIAVQLSHEILEVPGIQFIELPPEFQTTVVFSAAIAAGSKDPGAAKALVEFLTSPGAAAVIRAKGMQPG